MRDNAGVYAKNWGIGIEAAKRTRLVITQSLYSHITFPTPSTVLHSPTASLKKKNGRRRSSTSFLGTPLRLHLTNLQQLARLSCPKQFTVFGARTPITNVTEANIKNSASVDMMMNTGATFLHVK
jgi:hypothetical protein